MPPGGLFNKERIMAMKYNHTCTGYLVDDVEKAVVFYRDTLGFRISRQSETFAQLTSGENTILFFWKWEHLCEHLGEEPMKKVKHRVQSAIRFDCPEDVDAAYAELKAEGVDFVAAPADWEWNAHAAYFVDENGYMWELYCWLK